MKNPVAFFSYNRVEHTNDALDALSKCSEKQECDFYFFADGPRSNSDSIAVDATRAVLHKWAKIFGAQVIEQSANIGLAQSIVGGVSDLCKRYGRVIVLEDDLIVSPDFLRFMIHSLNYYEDEPRVMQVGGLTIYPPEDLDTDGFLLPVTTTWGWATWERAWQSFAWKPKDIEAAIKDHHWLDLFNLHGAGSYYSMLEDRLAGRNDSWGILWWYAVSRNNGLVLYPTNSLVLNKGFDGSGTHCGASNFLEQGDVFDCINNRLPSPLSLPITLEYLPAHLTGLEEFLRRQHFDNAFTRHIESTKIHSLITLAKRIKNRLRHVIG